jgi:hypothetical protein
MVKIIILIIIIRRRHEYEQQGLDRNQWEGGGKQGKERILRSKEDQSMLHKHTSTHTYTRTRTYVKTT